MGSRRRFLLKRAGMASALTVLVVALVWAGAWRADKPVANLRVGQPAPEFILPDLSGEEAGLARFRGRFVLLGFWASWCPPCREEMPSLQKLHEEFSGRDLALLTVNVGEPFEDVASFVRQQGLTFPVLLDHDGQVQALYGAYQFPVFFLIDRQGRLVARYLGLRDWSSPAVRQELAERMGQ